MKQFSLAVMALSLFVSPFAQADAAGANEGTNLGSNMPARIIPALDIVRAGSQPSVSGPADYFTGSVRVEPLFQPNPSSHISGAYVTFDPGARTAWHTHPLGQRLVVTAGTGRVQRVGGPVEEIRPGDVVWIPPGVKHWHGAAPDTAMTHLAIQEPLNGNTVRWMEKVSNEQYYGKQPDKED